MRTGMLIVFFVIAGLHGYAQSPINAVLGIPLGSSESTVLSEMKKRGNTSSDRADNYRFFKEVQFGKYDKCFATFYFYDDKVYKALILRSVKDETMAIREYNDVVAELTDKYGEPTNSEGKAKREDRNTQINTLLPALNAGEILFRDNWIREGQVGTLSTHIRKTGSTLFIYITYQHAKLLAEKEKKAEEKILSDY